VLDPYKDKFEKCGELGLRAIGGFRVPCRHPTRLAIPTTPTATYKKRLDPERWEVSLHHLDWGARTVLVVVVISLASGETYSR